MGAISSRSSATTLPTTTTLTPAHMGPRKTSTATLRANAVLGPKIPIGSPLTLLEFRMSGASLGQTCGNWSANGDPGAGSSTPDQWLALTVHGRARSHQVSGGSEFIGAGLSARYARHAVGGNELITRMDA